MNTHTGILRCRRCKKFFIKKSEADDGLAVVREIIPRCPLKNGFQLPEI
jgi:hypothetical protein